MPIPTFPDASTTNGVESVGPVSSLTRNAKPVPRFVTFRAVPEFAA